MNYIYFMNLIWSNYIITFQLVFVCFLKCFKYSILSLLSLVVLFPFRNVSIFSEIQEIAKKSYDGIDLWNVCFNFFLWIGSYSKTRIFLPILLSNQPGLFVFSVPWLGCKFSLPYLLEKRILSCWSLSLNGMNIQNGRWLTLNKTYYM